MGEQNLIQILVIDTFKDIIWIEMRLLEDWNIWEIQINSTQLHFLLLKILPIRKLLLLSHFQIVCNHQKEFQHQLMLELLLVVTDNLEMGEKEEFADWKNF